VFKVTVILTFNLMTTVSS